MAGYDQKIKIKAAFEKDGRNFFSFLQKVGKKYERPVKIKYRYLGCGYFYVVINGGSRGIDALFQELILNRGLYYYACTLTNKQKIISSVVLPIYKNLIDCRFSNPQSRFIRKHILGKYSQKDFIPGDIKNSHGQLFEVLFRRWDLKIISNKDYIIELDVILTDLMLNKLNYKKGERSEEFCKVLESFEKLYIFDEEIITIFQKIHEKRTKLLHRQEVIKDEDYLYEISTHLFRYFEYLDEFEESQLIKYVYGRRGKKAKRLKYGSVIWKIEGQELTEPAEKTCHDCGVKK